MSPNVTFVIAILGFVGILLTFAGLLAIIVVLAIIQWIFTIIIKSIAKALRIK